MHEAYLRLAGQNQLNFDNTSHFFGIAARSMRQILIDYARKRKAAKRSAIRIDLTVLGASGLMLKNEDQILALDHALTKLSALDPRKAKIVELRYFSGLTIKETSECLSTSPATVKRDWRLAKAWLYREMR